MADQKLPLAKMDEVQERAGVTPDLVARLEGATAWSQKLDLDIALATGWVLHDFSGGARLQDHVGNWHYSPPMYTGTIEDALKLLPTFVSYELTKSAAGDFSRCRLWDWRRAPTMSDPDNEWKAEGDRPLPINISIAALRLLAEPTHAP